jgi:hypothetical protein
LCIPFLTPLTSAASAATPDDIEDAIETGAAGQPAEFLYKELNFIGGYSDNEGLIGKTRGMLKNSAGFEYFRKFSDQYGDRLTLDLQMRYSYDSIEDSREAHAIEIHNAWLEYKLGLGRSLTIGHFDPAFGLEPVVDTHSSLLQTLAMHSLGYTKDWGIGYKTLLGDFDFQIAAQLGSGMPLYYYDHSYLLTTRIAAPMQDGKQLGLSFAYGRTLSFVQERTIPAPDLLNEYSEQKKLISLDYQSPLGPFGFKGEIAAGDKEGDTVGGALTEFSYVLPDNQNVTFKLQASYWADNFANSDMTDETIAPVVEYKINNEWSFRAGYFHDLEAMEKKDRIVLFQLYYYGL